MTTGDDALESGLYLVGPDPADAVSGIFGQYLFAAQVKHGVKGHTAGDAVYELEVHGLFEYIAFFADEKCIVQSPRIVNFEFRLDALCLHSPGEFLEHFERVFENYPEAKKILDELGVELEKLEKLQKFFDEIKSLVRNLGKSNMINKSEIESVIDEYEK